MTMRDLLSVRPPEDQVRDASRRARIGALARFDGERRNTAPWVLLPFATALTLALILLMQPTPQPPAPTPKQPLRVNLTLTDGTRVVWTFDDNLGL